MKPSTTQARRHGGAFRGRASPQMTACAPQTKIVPPQAMAVPRRNSQARGHWSANRGLRLLNWCLLPEFL